METQANNSRDWFRRLAAWAAEAVGFHWAFIGAVLTIAIWAVQVLYGSTGRSRRHAQETRGTPEVLARPGAQMRRR